MLNCWQYEAVALSISNRKWKKLYFPPLNMFYIMSTQHFLKLIFTYRILMYNQFKFPVKLLYLSLIFLHIEIML